MGQARNRGNFEQRVEQAREAFNTDIDAKKQDIAGMEALEARQIAAMGQYVNLRVLPQMERQYGPLMRVDFSNIELKITANAVAPAEALANQNETL